MKYFIFIILLVFNLSSQSQSIFYNINSNSAICKFEINNGKTTVFEDIDGVCPAFKTWNQVPVMFENNYSGRKFKMTVTTNTSISKRTYYIEYKLLSGAGENRDKKNSGYIKLTIDYFDKKRPKKVVEEYFTLQN